MDQQQLPADEYAGPAVATLAPDSRLAGARTSTTDGDAPAPVVEVRGTSLETTPADGVRVEVTLRGHFEPIDGRFHWYGRLAADEALSQWQPGTTVVLTTPGGSAAGRLSDVDPWGRFRISGTGRPPF
jgi:hypothetical protein